jgi:MarR family transcriptional regulator, transcriptional regulator for hemolysin
MYRQSGTHQPPNPLHIVGHAYRTFARIVDAQLRGLGLAMSQLPVLIVLKQGKPLPQAELARIAHVEQSSMAQLLNRMERDGLVERIADPADKRSRLISLTERASRRMHKGKAIMDATVEIALQGFSAADIEQLDRLMRRINENLERAAEEGDY